MNNILQGDSWQLAKQLDDESVDCVVTSPPYWGLRDYGVTGQAGLEEHPQLWVDKMVQLCELLRPKLKKSGVMFWNIGETYYGSGMGSQTGNPEPSGKQIWNMPYESRVNSRITKNNWLQPKQMLGLPWRFAIAMQDKGWILRNSIIWDKPNHMPSSVKDRFSNGYEYVFMFVKSRKYWFDLDAVREPHKTPFEQLQKDKRGLIKEGYKENTATFHHGGNKTFGETMNPSGKNCGDVWRITTRPHPFAHFAVFPEALAERCIKAGCPEWVCKKCSKPRERIQKIIGKSVGHKPREDEVHLSCSSGQHLSNNYQTVGWSDCGCNAGWQGGVCLDPFMGSGTVAVVSKRLGRQYLGFELNQKYIEIAENRLKGVTDWKTVKDIESGKQKILGEVGR